VQVSNGDGLIGFLRISCRHDFRNQGRKLDVDAQTDTNQVRPIARREIAHARSLAAA